jgi:hypothetical protein
MTICPTQSVRSVGEEVLECFGRQRCRIASAYKSDFPALDHFAFFHGLDVQNLGELWNAKANGTEVAGFHFTLPNGFSSRQPGANEGGQQLVSD